MQRPKDALWTNRLGWVFEAGLDQDRDAYLRCKCDLGISFNNSVGDRVTVVCNELMLEPPAPIKLLVFLGKGD